MAAPDTSEARPATHAHHHHHHQKQQQQQQHQEECLFLHFTGDY